MISRKNDGSKVGSFLLGIGVLIAIFLIVFSAIAKDVLWLLIVLVIAIGVISVFALHSSSGPISQIAESVRKNHEEHNRHIEAMAKIGYLPTRVEYKPMPLPEPIRDFDIPVDTSGLTSSAVEAWKPDAIELIALSKQIMELHDNSTQVAPFHKARKNPYFFDVEVWMNAIKWLTIHQYTYEKKVGNRSEGNFVRSGTVGQLYDKIKEVR